MKLKWNGHSCFSMTFASGVTLVTDPYDDTTGYPMKTVPADIATLSHHHFDHDFVGMLSGDPTVIDTDGAREVKGVKITGTPSWHDDAEGAKRGPNMLYRIEADGLVIVHLGDLGHMPNEAQLKAISGADLMLIPIGGFFTIDTKQAAEVIRMAKPRCAAAMHFANQWCKFPIQDETEFVRLTGAEYVGNEIEVTADGALPGAIVMKYEA